MIDWIKNLSSGSEYRKKQSELELKGMIARMAEMS
jgi:hypothetical protein